MMEQVIGCVDGSKATEAVCQASVWAASRIEAPLIFLHALEHENLPMTEDHSGAIGLGAREELLDTLVELEASRAQLELKQGQLVLQAVRERAERLGLASVNTLQRHGALTETLATMEATTRLVVVGRQGLAHETFERAIGSHIESLIRLSARPVLVVAEDFKIPSEFMLAYDGSATADKALQMVAASPLLQQMRCHLVTVGEDAGPLETAKVQLLEAGFEVTAQQVTGNSVAVALVAYQAENPVELTVMGAYGHSRIRQFFVGSQTTSMLQRSLTPLLLLR